jgi:16S rRNA (cytosine1402-N4)-methyltransferase
VNDEENDWPFLAPDPKGVTHEPVLLTEVLDALQVRVNVRVIDGTLGGAGHTSAILKSSAPSGRVLGIDADPAALRRSLARLDEEIQSRRLLIANGRFADMEKIAIAQEFVAVDGILLDLGISTFQLETAERGFSFQDDGPLDMRFDPSQATSAAEIVNHWPEEDLASLIYRFGDEHRSRQIARSIVRHRPIESTRALASVVENAVGGRRGNRIHPATKTFQALRIAVNQELEQLEAVLPQCVRLLKPGGRLAVIAFHSLEDRLVKQWMAAEASEWIHDARHPLGGVAHQATIRLVTRKALVPADEEMGRNPRSRSARLRVAERLAEPVAGVRT